MCALGVLWNLILSGCPQNQKSSIFGHISFEKSGTRATFSQLQSLVIELNSCTSVKKGLGGGHVGEGKKKEKKMRTLIYCMKKGRRVGGHDMR